MILTNMNHVLVLVCKDHFYSVFKDEPILLARTSRV
jgi:hypothetical protein